MELAKTVENASESLSDTVEVETPREVTELDSFLAVGSVYNPLSDTMEVNPEVDQEEAEKSVERDLISKYMVDETIGDTGMEEFKALESEIGRYRAIEGFDILEEDEWEIRSTDEIHEELIDEHGEEMEEVIEEVEEMGPATSDTSEVDIESVRETEKKSNELRKDNLRGKIGKDEQITERLAALHLSDFDETIEEYREQYQDFETEKEEVRENYWEDHDSIWQELEETVENEEVLEAAQEVRTQAMEFDLKTGKVDLNVERELRGEETEKPGTDYTREDIADALDNKGIQDDEVIDRVYELFRHEEQLDDEKDERIDELNTKQMNLHTDLMDELDKTAEEMEDEIDLYTEPIKQREWKMDALPVMEISASLQTLYKAHQDGMLERPRENYQARMEAFVDQKYKKPDEISKHLDKMIDIYEMQEGTAQEKLQATFQKAPEYAT